MRYIGMNANKSKPSPHCRHCLYIWNSNCNFLDPHLLVYLLLYNHKNDNVDMHTQKQSEGNERNWSQHYVLNKN